MNWHFGARPPDGGDPPLFHDEVRHCIRKGDGPEVQLPFHAALILKLLLRMHARGLAAVGGDERARLPAW